MITQKESKERVKQRIATAKLIQLECDCRQKGSSIVSGSAHICMHYSFAAVFSEYVIFWNDPRNPNHFSPSSNVEVNMACKRECGSKPYMIQLSLYIVSLGCDACTGKGKRGDIAFERSVASNQDMMKLWSKTNTVDPKTIIQQSKKVFTWQCLKDQNHQWDMECETIFNGGNCRRCPKSHVKTCEEMEKLFIEAHGDTYEYDWTTYRIGSEKMTIICMEHGEFEQMPVSHFNGHGCTKCAYDNITMRIPFAIMLDRIRRVWGDEYDYNESTYRGTNYPFEIICRKHGIFEKTIGSHLRQKSGCPTCTAERIEPKGVTDIKQFLTLGQFQFSPEKWFDDLRGITGRAYRYDLNAPELILLIDRDGEQHFNIGWRDEAELLQDQRRDILKDRYAISKGYNFIRVPYWINVQTLLILMTGVIARIRAGFKVYITYEHYRVHVTYPSSYLTSVWQLPKRIKTHLLFPANLDPVSMKTIVPDQIN